jgi:aryl-alcohol dehydrogenase-like predicted oxidoreductase
MEMRQLGRSSIKVAPLAFGGNVFGWTADEATSGRLLDAFVGAGFNLIDTADVYSSWVPGNAGGESEAIIGRWLARTGKRDKVVLATKVGMPMAPDRKGLSRAYIFREVEESLRRLKTDRIDLYQSHRDDPDTPLEETLGAYAELIRAGKVRIIGASNYGPERLVEARRLHREKGLPAYEVLQPEYNLCDRADYETKLEPVCREQQLGVIPYFSLACGFLTGKYRAEADLANRARADRVRRYLNPRGWRILAELDRIAGAKSATPAQVALAWLMSRPGLTAPIASATSVEQLDEIMGSVRLKLTLAEVADLNKASALIG